jgi:arsenate reductase
MEKKTKVLFLCAESPVRGAMAEGFLHQIAGDEFICASASVDAVPVNPLAVEVMQEVGIDITTQHEKDTAEALKEHFAFVVSICDMSKERNPVFPFAFRILRWDIPDPECLNESRDQQLAHFRNTRDEIERQVRVFMKTAAETMAGQGVTH